MTDKLCKDCKTLPECQGSNIEDCQRREDKLAEVRNDIAQVFFHHDCPNGIWSCAVNVQKEGWLKEADQILNTPITIEGGVCPRCAGHRRRRILSFPQDTIGQDGGICMKCKGTGRLDKTKTIKELIEEAMG